MIMYIIAIILAFLVGAFIASRIEENEEEIKDDERLSEHTRHDL